MASSSSSSSSSSRVNPAKLHVEEIRSKKFSIGKKEPNPLTEDLHHAVTNLSAELYTKDVHFLMELIQNAEDNEYPDGVEPTLEFVLTMKDITGRGAPATLLIFNNEVGFSKQNIESVCSIGRSTKKGRRKLGFIGEKGIGFKSVFLVSDCPHVFSNGYRVRFSENPDKDCGIGYIFPEWVASRPFHSDIRDVYGSNTCLPTTILILPLKPGKVEAVKAQLSELHPELLLFLLKIKRLHVCADNLDKAPNNVSIVSIRETDHLEPRNKRADSRIVQLSVKEKMFVAEETCTYYMWRQVFPVKAENRVAARMDAEEWTVTLAFPCGTRLTRGTTPVGVFAFLPTAMVTNFPFVMQADFVLASSRETILLDNKWNLGILECIPSAFTSAVISCLKTSSLCFSVLEIFKLLHVKYSPYPELNKVRESIRMLLKGSNIVPCSSLHGKITYCQPSRSIRILPNFRKLLHKAKRQGVPLVGLFSLKKYVLCSSLDIDEYSAILDFLGVQSACENYDWYAKCIRACDIALQASEEVYIDLLLFVADASRRADLFSKIPLLKHINREGNVGIFTLSGAASHAYKVQYAMESELNDWLIKCNMEFGCPDNMFFLPNATQQALVAHVRFSFLQNWLSFNARVTSCSALNYGYSLRGFVASKKDPKLAVSLAQYIYHSHKKKFIDDSSVSRICRDIPVIDGSGNLRTQRIATLVPSSLESKWVKLLGPSNPFVEHGYVDLGDVYGATGQFAGEDTPEKELVIFLSKHSGAVDLEGLCPPNSALQVSSSQLSCERALLLLDWIRSAKAKSILPQNFVESVSNGKWLKTLSGLASPSHSILPDASVMVIFDFMKSFMEDLTVVDHGFYMNKIALYADVLQFLGVAFGFNGVLKLVLTRCKCRASSEMSKDCALSLLYFLGYLKAASMLDEEWLSAVKEGKWLKTSQGYCAPAGSVLLQAGVEVQAFSSITDVPVIDEGFYGSKIFSFSTELQLLGVASNIEQVYKLVAENIVFPLRLNSINGSSGLLILKCIRYSGSASNALVDKVRNQPWLKTHSGVKCPIECILPDADWSCLVNGIEVPVIDEAFYGGEIKSFLAELKAIGVAVEFDSAIKLMELLAFSSRDSPGNFILLLEGIRMINQALPSSLSKLHDCLSSEEWLKTRHGYKTPSESLLFDLKWGTISLFVDLPLVDDSFYGISIYRYRDELKLIGVITDFARGAVFVARGLHCPVEPSVVSAEGTISLLECIKCLMSNSNDASILAEFVDKLRSSKWLKTSIGYKGPQESILLDPDWDGILCCTDAPIIDQMFYATDVSLYKSQLRIVGVKVDYADVCSLLFEHLLAAMETRTITRICNFLHKFSWKPESVD